MTALDKGSSRNELSIGKRDGSSKRVQICQVQYLIDWVPRVEDNRTHVADSGSSFLSHRFLLGSITAYSGLLGRSVCPLERES